MTQQEEKHPVAAGLIALVAVGLAVGLMLGIFTLLGSHVVGLGGDDNGPAVDAGPSLYLPSPSPTRATGSAAPSAATAPASPKPPPRSKPAKRITLQAGETSVRSMQRIDLSGVYPGGEGADLRVQRMESSTWVDFPVTASVSGGQFSTYVQTGRSGKQKFRVRDARSGLVSNVVAVTIG